MAGREAESVGFIAMQDGVKAEYEMLDRLERAYAADLAARLTAALAGLEDSLSGYRVTRLGHSLQSATRAWRDGADEDWVVSALLHDIGDGLAPWGHARLAETVLQPFVREQCAWVVGAHGDFQKYYYAHHLGGDRMARERHRDSPYFDDCALFCARWDQCSFDPDYDTQGLDFFRPVLDRVFARKAWDPAVIRPGERVPLTGTPPVQG